MVSVSFNQSSFPENWNCLSFPWINVDIMVMQFLELFHVYRSVFLFSFGRVIFEAVVSDTLSRSHGPFFKTPSAIGTNIVQDVGDAIDAERAFECTNHGLVAVVWKFFAAVFTNRSKFQHNNYLMVFDNESKLLLQTCRLSKIFKAE